MQIGLTREQVNVEGDLTLASLKEIACAFVDRKVKYFIKIAKKGKICTVFTHFAHTQLKIKFLNSCFSVKAD